MLQDELNLGEDNEEDDFGLVDSKIMHKDDHDLQIELNRDLGMRENNEMGDLLQEEDGTQRRTLRRTSRIFEYYNKGKKNSMSKKKRKRRITSNNGGNNILSAQSCTRGSNI